eukprot:840351-Amphidinium_carterae.1
MMLKTILRIQIGDQVSSLQECKRTWHKRLKHCWPMKWCQKDKDGTVFLASCWVLTRDRALESASTLRARPTCCQHSTTDHKLAASRGAADGGVKALPGPPEAAQL